MTSLLLRTFPNPEAIGQAAAQTCLQLAKEAIANHGQFTIALSGGSTPKRLFQILAEAPFVGQMNWSKTHVFWGDERSVPPDHADSNYKMANDALLAKISIPQENVHRMEAEREDRDAAAQEYQQKIANVFGATPSGPPPAFDLILLGMGPDGHTASLFPGTEALGVTNKWVTPNFVPQKDTHRTTFTYPLINAAKQVLFLIAGADKADRLFEVWTGPTDAQRLPSQRIGPSAGTLAWYVDQAAIAKLTAGLQSS